MQIEIGKKISVLQCQSKANFSVLFVTKSHQSLKSDLFTLEGVTNI